MRREGRRETEREKGKGEYVRECSSLRICVSFVCVVCNVGMCATPSYCCVCQVRKVKKQAVGSAADKPSANAFQAKLDKKKLDKKRQVDDQYRR